eukprot:TRINITY_DN18070_c0_g1_i1.p1 TRINITY_DN18070_c0_g1~~TRINITY_DN18070_c0_g1_i1.p1  ORF type:complete len:1498 (-),score=286.29 TRINITY_DN18070_c0_g1_i1:42-3923(-)
MPEEENDPLVIPASEALTTRCTCFARLLGNAQPIDPVLYGLPDNELVGDVTETLHSEFFDETANQVTKDCFELPSGCLFSVPAELWGSDVNVSMQIAVGEAGATKEWGNICNFIGATERGTYCYRLQGSQESLRIHPIKRIVRETCVNDVGAWATAVDLLLLPLFSFANGSPVPLEAEVTQVKGPCRFLTLPPGKVVHRYDFDVDALKQDMKLRVRLKDNQAWAWSNVVHGFYSMVPRTRFDTREPPRDEKIQVVNENSKTVASCGLVVRCGDVCVVTCPIWLRDWTGLKLRCVDAHSADLNKFDGHFMLDPGAGTASLVVDLDKVQEDQGVDGSLRISAGRGASRQARAALPRIITSGSKSMTIVAQGGPNIKGPKVFPLRLKTQTLPALFGRVHSPTAHLTTVEPGLVIGTDCKVLVRQSSKATGPVPKTDADGSDGDAGATLFVEGERKALWLEEAARPLYLMFKLVGVQAEWTKPVLIDQASLGVHSVATEGRYGPALLGIVISDEATESLHVSVSASPTAKPALEICNSAPKSVRTAWLETDSPANMRDSTTSALGASFSGAAPPWAFSCSGGERAGAGWYRAFEPGAVTDKVTLYLQWITDEKVVKIPSLQLLGYLRLVVLRPVLSDSSCAKHWEDMWTVVSVVFKHGQVAVVMKDVSQGISQDDLVNVACGACGAGKPDIKGLTDLLVTCPTCHVKLHVPIVINNQVNNSCFSSGTMKSNSASENSEVNNVNNGRNAAARFLDFMSWIPRAKLFVEINIPSVGISVVSKRQAKELLFVLCTGIWIKLQGQIYDSQSIDLTVADVRVDQQLEQTDDPATIVVAKESETDVDKKHSLYKAPVAIRANVLRVCGTSWRTICLQDVNVALERQFDVDVRTNIVTKLFEFGDEFANALFASRFHRSKDPGAALKELAMEASRGPVYKEPRLPLVMHLENFSVSDVCASVSASLRLDEMNFVPSAVVHLVRILTLSKRMDLDHAQVVIHELAMKGLRSSAKGVAMSLLTHYVPHIINVSGSILKASNLSKAITVPVRGAAVVMRSVASRFAKRDGMESSNSLRPEQNNRRTLQQQQQQQQWRPLDAERLRVPRLLHIHSSLVPFHELEAVLLHRLGAVFPTLFRHVNCVLQLSKSPVLAVVASPEEVLVAELCVSFEEALHVDVRPAADVSRAKTCTSTNERSAITRIANGDHVWGPWKWQAINKLRFESVAPRTTGKRGSANNQEQPPRFEVSISSVDVTNARLSRTNSLKSKDVSMSSTFSWLTDGGMKPENVRRLVGMASRLIKTGNEQ